MSSNRLRIAVALVVAGLLVPAASAQATAHTPSVIAHRGASGYRPENTLAAATLAIRQGADEVEADVVPTKDGVLIVRNDNELSGTTDVVTHPEFADRRTSKTVDGLAVTGWFSEDFTLREIRTLRAIERLPELRPSNTVYDGRFRIPTLTEILRVTHGRARVYIELKHPTYFRSIGLPLEERLRCELVAAGLTRRNSAVQVQSFEPSSLRRLRAGLAVPLVQGLDVAGRPYDFTATGDPRTYADLRTPAGLRWIHRYADAVAVNAALIIPRDATNHVQPATTLVADAHAAGLLVQAWTFRAENDFLPADIQRASDPAGHGDLIGFLWLVYATGLDGVFCEFPDLAVSARA